MSGGILKTIEHRWKELGIPFRPGLERDTVSAFERRYRVRLPASVRSFYEFIDGMPAGYTDEELISFWPLTEVTPVPEKLAGCRGIPDYGGIEESLPEAASFFVFADHSIWLNVYAVQLSADSMASAPVIWIGGGDCWHVLAPSFGEFLARYAQEPSSVLV
jgi:hypothetical protein